MERHLVPPGGLYVVLSMVVRSRGTGRWPFYIPLASFFTWMVIVTFYGFRNLRQRSMARSPDYAQSNVVSA